MKSKLYRVLVLLVAIAMMIPSFALAEETTTPKVEWTAFTGEDFSVKLTNNLINTEYSGKDGLTPFTYAVTDTTGEGYHVEWKSDKPAVASVTDDETGLVDNVPDIKLHALGEATITGTLVNNYGEKNSVTKSFTVTLTEEPVTKFELTKKTDKVMLSSNTYTLDNLINTSTIEPTNATYADPDNFEWSITKGGDCARLKWNNELRNNELELKKAGTVELSVKAKGASTAAAQTFALTILDSEEADPTEVGYSKITFTTKSIDEDTNYINVSKYLKTEKPADFTDDDVVWTSSDESIASVYASDDGEYVRFFVDEGSVVITAASRVDPAKASDTITVNYKKAEKNVYETVEFDKKAATVNADRSPYVVTVTATLKDEKRDPDDILVYTVDDPQIAITEYGEDWDEDEQELETVETKAEIYWWATRITEEKKVVVTVRSKNNPEKARDQFTLTIKPVAKPIQTIKLAQTDFTLKWSYPKVYLWDYIDTDPVDYYNDSLIFTSDRPDHVKVDDSGWAYVDADCVPGKAVITVRSKKGEAESKTFNIEYVKDGVITSAKFVGAPTEITPNYNYDEDSDEYYDVDLAKYLTVEPSYYELSELDLYWDSSDPQVATVNDKGRVTVEGIGNVTITVSDKTGKELAKHTMKVSAKYPLVEKVELKDITLKVGDNLNLYTDNFMNWTPRDAKCKDIKWVSSNRDVAEVQGNFQIGNESDRLTEGFYIVAYKAGETTITVNVENHDGTVKTASCKVTVTDVEAESVEFAAKQYTLKLNTKLTAKVRFNLVPYNASADDLYIVTNNPDVIELGTNGYWDEEDHYVTEDFTVKNGKGYVTITAVKPGKAWIGIRRASDDKELGSVKVVVETVKVKRFKLPKNSVTLNWYDDGKPTANAVANYTYKNSYIVEPVITPSKAYYTVSYETSDPSVAFVADRSELEGDYAKIVASGVGKCTITVKVDDGKKVRVSKLKVTVVGKTPKPVIDQKKATINMNKGEKSITLNVYDADTKEALKVTWASSDNKVAKVNKNGKVTAVGAGKATITATHKDTGKTLKCIVTVKAKSTENADKVKKITGDAKVSVKVGEKKTLNIKVKPAGAKVTFKSSDTSIVKVGKDGQIKGVKAGKATITVSGDGVEFKIKVTVKK